MAQPHGRQRTRPTRSASTPSVGGEKVLHLLPRLWINQRGMLTREQLAAIAHLAGVERVGQQLTQPGLAEYSIPAPLPLARRPCFRAPATPVQLAHHRQERLAFQVERKDR